METVTQQDDSTGANTSSVKSDDGSPRPENGRGSPPPNCAICLGTCRNKSFTDSCLHQFCFSCLLTWSKVKAECPLCKQNFKSIIHNVRSNQQYEEYMVEQTHTEDIEERIEIDSINSATRRFRYRTTLTLPRRESMAIQQLLLHYPMVADILPLPMLHATPARRRRDPSTFRRTIYRHNLWARSLPDFTGRFRDCSPEFYRYNEAQMHRLVPWLNRELNYLLNENVAHISYVMDRILEFLPQYHITSTEFRDAMRRYFGERTEHFLHELFCFASTPYDMPGYDRNVQYTTDSRVSTMVNEVISSAESEASADSDIVMVSSSHPSDPPAGPSRIQEAGSSNNYIPNSNMNNVIPIETISHSETDDDNDDVMVVGYIKPPQDRTPEIVDLLGSDSDVVVQEPIQPEPQTSGNLNEPQEEQSVVPLVKVSLKRHKPSREHEDSDSDSSYFSPVRNKNPKKRLLSNGTSTTLDTRRGTPSPVISDWNFFSSSSSSSSYDTPTSSSDLDTLLSSDSDSSVRSKPIKKQIKKKKSKKKTTKSKPRNKKSTKQKSLLPSAETNKKNKHKSYSGKGVKSSKKHLDAADKSPANEPSTSKKATNTTSKDGESSRESRRLKSVVKVMNNPRVNSEQNNVMDKANSSNDSDSGPGSSRCRTARKRRLSNSMHTKSTSNSTASDSDSDDDSLPLNLTMKVNGNLS